MGTHPAFVFRRLEFYRNKLRGQLWTTTQTLREHSDAAAAAAAAAGCPRIITSLASRGFNARGFLYVQ